LLFALARLATLDTNSGSGFTAGRNASPERSFAFVALSLRRGYEITSFTDQIFCRPFVLSGFGFFRGIGTVFKTKVDPASTVITQPVPDTRSEEERRNELLATTYPGRRLAPSETQEPLFILTAYLARDTHKARKIAATDDPELDQDIQQWEDIVRQEPNSRLAHEELGRLYRQKGENAGNDRDFLQKALVEYTKATQIGLGHGIIRYTRELSELCVTLNDKANLDAVFTEVLSQPREADRGNYYQALVDYADGLAWLQDDQRAWGYVEDALRFHPEQKIEAVNRYAFHLLYKQKAREAVTVLETQLTAQERSILVLPAYFRKEALAALGEDITDAEEEVAWLRKRVSENGGSSAIRFVDSRLRHADRKALGFKEFAKLLLTPVSEAQAFSHTPSSPSDDCRNIDYETAFDNGNLCDITGICYDPYSVNLAEIIDNEAKPERPGARYAVGWTVKNRAFQSLTAAAPDAFGNYGGPACDSYPGAQGGALTSTCITTIPCGHEFCVESKKVCCAAHGGTTTDDVFVGD
jgi:hypothetical protein